MLSFPGFCCLTRCSIAISAYSTKFSPEIVSVSGSSSSELLQSNKACGAAPPTAPKRESESMASRSDDDEHKFETHLSHSLLTGEIASVKAIFKIFLLSPAPEFSRIGLKTALLSFSSPFPLTNFNVVTSVETRALFLVIS
uniref:CSON010054 protein n=1 Tax=Culicoides sonorensis TaxID=179676 RepID=A0A336MZ29_CULSO